MMTMQRIVSEPVLVTKLLREPDSISGFQPPPTGWLFSINRRLAVRQSAIPP